MEANKNNLWKVATVVGWLICAVLVWAMFNYRDIALIAESNLVKSKDSIIQIINKNETLTASVNALQLSEGQYKQMYSSKNAELKELTGRFAKLQSVTQFKAVATLPSISHKFDTPIVIGQPCGDTTKTKPLNLTGPLEKDWFKGKYRITNDSVVLEEPNATIGITSVTGFKRKWLLGRLGATTDVTPSSKNVTVVQMQSTHVTAPRTILDKILAFALGAYLGYEIKN